MALDLTLAPEHPSSDEMTALSREVKAAEQLAAWRDLREAGGFDLLAVDTTKPTEWVPAGERIIRQREQQSWIAEEGAGKTQAALHLAAQVCDAGRRVIYVDVENDPDEMASRFERNNDGNELVPLVLVAAGERRERSGERARPSGSGGDGYWLASKGADDGRNDERNRQYQQDHAASHRDAAFPEFDVDELRFYVWALPVRHLHRSKARTLSLPSDLSASSLQCERPYYCRVLLGWASARRNPFQLCRP
jgi:hypothetical protein